MRLTPILVLLCIAVSTFAKDKPQVTVPPAWLFPVQYDVTKKPNAKSISNGYYLELYDEQVNLKTQTTYTHYIRNISNETGIQNSSEVSVSFSPEYQTLSFHYARIIRGTQVISHLSTANIQVIQEETDREKYQYNNIRRAFIILKDVRKGDKIEVAYSVTGFNPVYNNKFACEIYLSNDNPVVNYFQTIITEPSRKLQFHYSGNVIKPQESVLGDSKIYHWDNPPLTLWQSISGTPSWYEPYPSIVVSEFSSWNEIVNWGIGLNNNYETSLPASIKTRIASWHTQANGDKDEFIRLALRYVQDDIRYLGLEVGINTHRPHFPEEVIGNGYGDCKDKALLLASILRSENIPAWVALVNTTARRALLDKMPSPNEFDHTIVAIERTNSFKYVDPTLSFQRGDLPDVYTPPYQYALLLKPGETALRFIDPAQNNIVRIFERLNVSFTDSSKLIVNSTYRGGKADATRSYLVNTSDEVIKDVYEKYYATIFDGIVMSKSLQYEDDSINNVVKVNEEYSIPKIWNDDDTAKLFFSTYAKVIDEIITDPTGKPNKYPLSVSFPSTVYYTMDLEMPETWNIDQDSLHIKNDHYEFIFNVSHHGSLISLQYSLQTFSDHIPAAEVEKYKKDYKKIQDVVQYRFTYGGGSVDSSGDSISGVNVYPVLVALGVLGITALLFSKLNKRSVDVPYERNTGYQLGGWTVLLGITLVVSAGIQLYNLFTGGYFYGGGVAAWKLYGNAFVVTVFVELALTVFAIASNFAVLYWYFKKRDIFPSMFTAYVVMLLVIQVVMYLLYQQFSGRAEFKDTISESSRQLFRSFIYGAIWTTYLARSTRSKGTFLKAYREEVV